MERGGLRFGKQLSKSGGGGTSDSSTKKQNQRRNFASLDQELLDGTVNRKRSRRGGKKE